MTASALASAIMGALTAALVGENGILTVVPAGIKTAFEALFITTSGETSNVSTFAVVMLVFGGVALAFGITKLVFNLISNKIGGR